MVVRMGMQWRLADSPADENELCRQLMGHPFFYAGLLITKYVKGLNDPEHACCSCERLHQKKSVSRVKCTDCKKYKHAVWQRAKKENL